MKTTFLAFGDGLPTAPKRHGEAFSRSGCAVSDLRTTGRATMTTTLVAIATLGCLVTGAFAAGTQEEAAVSVSTSAPPASTKSTVTARTPTNEPTIITAEQLHGDLHNVGTFEGNVLVVDPRMTVRADKMTTFFGTTNVIAGTSTNSVRSLQKIIADGGVVITTPDNKKTNSDHAEYTASDGKVVLTGHPRAESADGIVTGERIIFWRDSQRMDVEAGSTPTNRPRLLIYPEEQRKQNEDAK